MVGVEIVPERRKTIAANRARIPHKARNRVGCIAQHDIFKRRVCLLQIPKRERLVGFIGQIPKLIESPIGIRHRRSEEAICHKCHTAAEFLLLHIRTIEQSDIALEEIAERALEAADCAVVILLIGEVEVGERYERHLILSGVVVRAPSIPGGCVACIGRSMRGVIEDMANRDALIGSRRAREIRVDAIYIEVIRDIEGAESVAPGIEIHRMPLCRRGKPPVVARGVDERWRNIRKRLRIQDGSSLGKFARGEARDIRADEDAILPNVRRARTVAALLLPVARRSGCLFHVRIAKPRVEIGAHGLIDFVNRPRERRLRQKSRRGCPPQITRRQARIAHVRRKRHGRYDHERQHAEDDQQRRTLPCLHCLSSSLRL